MLEDLIRTVCHPYSSDFTEEEVHELKSAGAAPVGLGPCRLRVETATISLLSALMLWSDANHQETQQCS